jgi:hypothetical protein
MSNAIIAIVGLDFGAMFAGNGPDGYLVGRRLAESVATAKVIQPAPSRCSRTILSLIS